MFSTIALPGGINDYSIFTDVCRTEEKKIKP